MKVKATHAVPDSLAFRKGELVTNREKDTVILVTKDHHATEDGFQGVVIQSVASNTPPGHATETGYAPTVWKTDKFTRFHGTIVLEQ